MRRAVVGVLVAALGLVSSAACIMTREQGQVLERDVRTVEEEMARLKQQQTQREAALAQQQHDNDAKLQRVSEILERADATARRADADFFLKLDEMVRQVQELNGRIESMELRLAEVEAHLANAQQGTAQAAAAASQPAQVTPAEPPKPALPEDKGELYEYAKKAFDEGKLDESRAAFRVFLERFPKDPALSDNALFWIGESYFKQQTYDQAILTYQKVINQFSSSDKLDAALYKIGRSFEALGLREDAVLFYEDLVSKHPKSDLVPDASQRIKQVRASQKQNKKPRKGARGQG